MSNLPFFLILDSCLDLGCNNNNELGSLKNNTSWTISYYLDNWSGTRLTPCWTLDPPETKVSKPNKTMVMTEQ